MQVETSPGIGLSRGALSSGRAKNEKLVGLRLHRPQDGPEPFLTSSRISLPLSCITQRSAFPPLNCPARSNTTDSPSGEMLKLRINSFSKWVNCVASFVAKVYL